jgi:hypothetical protein
MGSGNLARRTGPATGDAHGPTEPRYGPSFSAASFSRTACTASRSFFTLG